MLLKVITESLYKTIKKAYKISKNKQTTLSIVCSLYFILSILINQAYMVFIALRIVWKRRKKPSHY